MTPRRILVLLLVASLAITASGVLLICGVVDPRSTTAPETVFAGWAFVLFGTLASTVYTTAMVVLRQPREPLGPIDPWGFPLRPEDAQRQARLMAYQAEIRRAAGISAPPEPHPPAP